MTWLRRCTVWSRLPHEPADRPWPVAGGAAVPLCGVLRHRTLCTVAIRSATRRPVVAARAHGRTAPRQPLDGSGDHRVLLSPGLVRQPAPAALVPEPGQCVHVDAVRPEPEIRPADGRAPGTHDRPAIAAESHCVYAPGHRGVERVFSV